jgi:MoaA/NifB/PqqE/SkfB family radical SAM enzyme
MNKPLLYREYVDFIESSKGRNVVIYDVGRAKDIIDLIRDKVNIAYIVNDDFWKWNTKISDFDVKSPHTLKGSDYVVLITQPYYAFSVEKNLIKYGITDYFCYGFFSENLTKSFKIGYGGRFVQGRTFLQAGRDNARLIVSLTNNCNLRCQFCAVRYKTNDGTPNMPLEQYIKLLEDAKELWCRGRLIDTIQMDGLRELFVYPKYKEAIIETAKRRFNIYLITNGVLLTPENSKLLLENGMNEILISVCGITPETYMKYQGYNERKDSAEFATRQLNKVKHNVKELIRQRGELNKQCAVGISYLIDNYSLAELKDAVMFWKEAGVDFFFGCALAKIASDGSIIERHKNSNPAIHRERCYQMWVSSNGDLTPCCGSEATTEKINLGNVFDSPIYDLINSDEFNEFHENLASLNPTKMHPLCTGCASSGIITMPTKRKVSYTSIYNGGA